MYTSLHLGILLLRCRKAWHTSLVGNFLIRDSKVTSSTNNLWSPIPYPKGITHTFVISRLLVVHNPLIGLLPLKNVAPVCVSVWWRTASHIPSPVESASVRPKGQLYVCSLWFMKRMILSPCVRHCCNSFRRCFQNSRLLVKFHESFCCSCMCCKLLLPLYCVPHCPHITSITTVLGLMDPCPLLKWTLSCLRIPLYLCYLPAPFQLRGEHCGWWLPFTWPPVETFVWSCFYYLCDEDLAYAHNIKCYPHQGHPLCLLLYSVLHFLVFCYWFRLGLHTLVWRYHPVSSWEASHVAEAALLSMCGWSSPSIHASHTAVCLASCASSSLIVPSVEASAAFKSAMMSYISSLWRLSFLLNLSACFAKYSMIVYVLTSWKHCSYIFP